VRNVAPSYPLLRRDLIVAVLRHPSLWATALRQAVRLAGRGWWRRPPFLPVPARDYLDFRLVTAYGSDRSPDPEDLLAYLRWCRAWPSG
jgi:hypothetical protein